MTTGKVLGIRLFFYFYWLRMNCCHNHIVMRGNNLSWHASDRWTKDKRRGFEPISGKNHNLWLRQELEECGKDFSIFEREDTHLELRNILLWKQSHPVADYFIYFILFHFIDHIQLKLETYQMLKTEEMQVKGLHSWSCHFSVLYIEPLKSKVQHSLPWYWLHILV